MTLGRITFGLVGTVFCGSGSQTETKKSKLKKVCFVGIVCFSKKFDSFDTKVEYFDPTQ